MLKKVRTRPLGEWHLRRPCPEAGGGRRDADAPHCQRRRRRGRRRPTTDSTARRHFPATPCIDGRRTPPLRPNQFTDSTRASRSRAQRDHPPAAMNLMFRKNFRENRSGGAGGGGGGRGGARSGNRHASKRLARDHGYTPIEEHHYRTHLFFSPPRAGGGAAGDDDEPRCGPVSGSGIGAGEGPPLATSISPALTEADLPAPLARGARRSPSVAQRNDGSRTLGPPGGGRGQQSTPSRQVSFNYGWRDLANNNVSNVDVAKTLSGLERDCFIIPVHALDRFLPAGVPMPKPAMGRAGSPNDATGSNLHVMEVPDPKLCVLCHLMSPLEPIDPILESPLVQPLQRQRAAAAELVGEVARARTAVTGMLLANMEKNGEFPFITYYVINTSQTNPVMFYNNLRTASLTKFDPRATRYTAAHTLDLYTEVASICRPPIHEIGVPLTKTHCPTTAYMVSVYKVFEGDDREKFERNWLYWTGARMIYRYLPAGAGLRRISLHKSLSPKGDKMYVLLCECSHLLADVTACALLLPALRARLTGYTGIFRPLQTF